MSKQKSADLFAEYHITRMQRLHVRWPAWVALVIVSILYEALPPIFYWGPRGLMISLVFVLLIPTVVTFWHNKMDLSRYFGLLVNVLTTTYLIASLVRLVQAVMAGHIGPQHLISSALALWIANILIFAIWYWSLDAGGPLKREFINNAHVTAFLFPQAQISVFGDNKLPSALKNWQPQFIDYLFLAFNTSTAFSPTDTPVLSRWAKIMGMIQAMISLTIVIMLVARAISILDPAASYLVS